MKKVKIGIAGCLGRMGRELIQTIHSSSNTEFVGGYEHHKNSNIGKSFKDILGITSKYDVESSHKDIFERAEVIIDFSHPNATAKNIKSALDYHTPLIIGTTGLSDKIFSLIKKKLKKSTYSSIIQYEHWSKSFNKYSKKYFKKVEFRKL